MDANMTRRGFVATAATMALATQAVSAAPKTKPPKWKDGKKWVYSITYDEGCEDLLKFAHPIHQKYGVPGHVAFVSTQIGIPRNLPGSSYHGMMILNKEQIHGLAKEGWGFSCHSLTHCGVKEENAQTEVVEARKVLEDAIELPISVFIVPGDNNGWPASKKYAPGAGYKAVITIFDRTNTQNSDLFSLGRTPLHTRYPAPFFSEFDPYKRIQQAIDWGGWIIDYCHCPMPDKPIHEAKDCTSQELEQRFEAVKRLGGRNVWIAEPNEVVDWLTREAK
jgi:hypothetical protein